MVRSLKQLRSAVSHLSPHEVRRTAGRALRVALVASSNEAYTEMEEFLAPLSLSVPKRLEVKRMLYRASDSIRAHRFDLVLCEQDIPCPRKAFTFYAECPAATVREILSERDDVALALARNFAPFRRPVVDQVISTVSRENALFALTTALPNFVPNLLELPWAAGEFASDTAFLTLNQIRMAFLIAAASDAEVGYSEQKGQIASIIAGAFGWRTLARELAGKIPFGGGLIAKGAIAFAGTYVVGLSLERVNRIGYGYSRAERKAAFHEALERGKAVAEYLLNGFRGRRIA